MAKDFWKLLDENEATLHQYLSRTRPMVPKRMKDGMNVREAIVDTITHLVTSDEASDGFKKLAKIGKLELTFEAFVLKWEAEFPAMVCAAARSRLNAAGYFVA